MLTPVDKLEFELNKPFFVLKMARGLEHRDDAMGRSAKKRADAARREIETIVKKWVQENE